MSTEYEYYLAKHNGGYYADHQPNYHWSFTEEVKKAKRYKTRRGAEDRLIKGQNVSHGNASSVYTVDKLIGVKGDGTMEELTFYMPEDDPNDPWKAWR